MLRLVQPDNSLDVYEDIIRPAKFLRQVAKCNREATKLFLKGLEYSPDNQDILREIEKTPNSKEVLLETGRMNLKEGDIVEAKKMFEMILDMYPYDKGALLEVGQMHLAKGNVAGAEEMFQRILHMHPDDFSASFELAKIEDKNQRRDLRNKIRNLHRGGNEDKESVLRKAV
ncbi:tetratricopeptide repeat protein [candidate division KSB1 bacterium]